jgi:hypothetical protein
MKKLVKIIFFIVTVTALSVTAMHAQVSVGVSLRANFAPPAIPVYVQPPCPVDGYIWQPGYWAYDPDVDDYYWVPGVWVAPPDPGLYWTPGYWGYDGGVYGFHIGYWGPHVGFYGGINYGCGYFGVGFCGGGWEGGRFRYNTAVVNVNRTVIRNTYIDRTVIQRNTIVNNRVSYNGGRGGVMARPRPEEQRAMNEHHIQPTRMQMAHQQAAIKDRSQFAKANHGQPSITAMRRVNTQQFAQSAHNQAGRTQQTARQHGQAIHNNAVQQASRGKANMRNNAAGQQQHLQAQRNSQMQHVQQQRMQAQRSQQRMQQQNQRMQQAQQQRFQAQRVEQQQQRVQHMQQQRMPQQRMQQPRMQQPRQQEPQREHHR